MAPGLSAFRGFLTRVVLAMPTSQVGAATRAFVALLLLLARRYELVLEVNRESSPEELVKAYKSLFRKVHPDRGGKKKTHRDCKVPGRTGRRHARQPHPRVGVGAPRQT